MRHLVAFCCLLWMTTALGQPSGKYIGPGVMIRDAGIAVTNVSSPPINATWDAIKLPYGWLYADNLEAAELNAAWYRFKLPTSVTVKNTSGIFLDRTLLNAAVYFNQDYLGNGGSMDKSPTNNWNTPLLFRVPTSSWHTEKTNYLYVKLVGEGGHGTMTPPIFGDYFELKQHWYDSKWFVRVELSRAAFMLMFLLGGFALLLWRYTRQRLLLIVSTAAYLYLLPLSYLYLRDVPIDQPIFVRLTHWVVDCTVLFILLFVREKYGQPIVKFVIGGAIYLLCLALGMILVPEVQVIWFSNAMHVISQAVILFLLWYAVRQFWLSRSMSDGSLVLGLLTIISLFIHDLTLSLSQSWERWLSDHHLVQLSMPIAFVLLCFSLSGMFRSYLEQLNMLNNNLTRRLELAKKRCDDQIDEGQALQQQKRLNDEREKVYADLHDDLGAKLLSLIYAGEDPMKVDLARSTLQDLRDVVSRRGLDRIQLGYILTDALAEQRQRCAQMNVDLNVVEQTVHESVHYSASDGLHIVRLIRELVGVGIHQLGAHELVVGVMSGHAGIEIWLQLDNNTTPTDLTSLNAKAGRLNGSIRTAENTQGLTLLVCWLPHAPDEDVINIEPHKEGVNLISATS